MTIYQNTAASPNINVAIGSPVLTVNDEVHIVVDSADYSTNLDSISSVKLDAVVVGPGYKGDIGNGNIGLEINADLLTCRTGGRKAAYKGVSGQTIDKAVWEPSSNAEGFIADADIDDLDALAGGPLVLADDCTLDNLYAVGNGVDVTLLGNPAAATVLHVSGGGGKAQVFNERDFASAIIGPGGVLTNATTDVTPSGNIDLSGGTLNHRGGNIGGTIKTDGYCVIDLRLLPASITINSWDVNGLLKILEPPAGITYTKPTASQIKGKVNYL